MEGALWFQKIGSEWNPWIIHNMLGTIPGSVLPFLSMCPAYIYIYIYLLDGANASNSIKTNFHFTAKPVLCTFWASILGLSEMANGDVPVQVAADGEKTVNSCQLTTPNWNSSENCFKCFCFFGIFLLFCSTWNLPLLSLFFNLQLCFCWILRCLWRPLGHDS